MKNKAETRIALSNFITLIQNWFNTNIKTIRSGNGQEFIWNDLFEKIGIIYQTSCVETPQQNVIVERKYQHILNIIQSVLFQFDVPVIFWSYALIHVVHT